MRYLIGIDNGGTFVKAGVVAEDGTIVSSAREPIHNRTPKPGYTERDMEELWQQNAKVIRQAMEESGIKPEELAGISFSGHGKGLYLIGEDQKPSYPGILSTDTRAWEYVKKWKADGTDKRIYKKTYQDILACQPVSLLAWLKDHEPTVYARTKYVFSVNDYIRFRLTGEANGEFTNFSGANLVNLDTKQYDRELLCAFGIEEVYEKLPPLVYAADLCGTTTVEASTLTGLPIGTPVAAGMFDVDACGLASGVIDEEAMCMIAGTWSINEYITTRPIDDGSVSLNSMYCMPGYFLVEESSPTSAGNLQWLIDNLLSMEKEACKQNGTEIYDLTNEMVSSLEPEDSCVVFLPFLNGSNEDALAKGTFVGLTDFHEKRHLVRAVYEGIVFSHVTHVKRLLKTRTAPKQIRLAGGAANSDVWVQMFADALQLPVETVACSEQGILGAAMAAGVGTGVCADFEDAVRKMVSVARCVMPRSEYKEIYERKFATYRKVIGALAGVWGDFAL